MMDCYIKERMYEHGLIYKRTLERIIDKYSQLENDDGAVELDLNTTKTTDLEQYMKLSRMKLTKLESKSQTDLGEQTQRAQDITRDSQLNYSHQDSGADEMDIYTNHSAVEPNEMFSSDSSQLTVSSLDESQRSFSLQPEDQDEELEKSLSSQGCSLMELYPSMISQIGRAWDRQHVSEAADSVLRRYRRLRWQSNRSNLNHTLNITLRHTNSNPKVPMNSKVMFKRSSNSSLNIDLPRISNTRTATALGSPLRILTNLQDWQVEKHSPGREEHLLKTDEHQPILVMDFSCTSGISSAQESFEPNEMSLNQTFTVSQVSAHSSSLQQKKQPIYLTGSPRKPYCPTTDASLDPPLRSDHPSLPSHTVQRAGCPVYVTETSAVTESSSIPCSPVRQNSLKTRLTRERLFGSPYALCRSPKSDNVGGFSRESNKPRSMSASPSSPSQKSAMLPRRFYPQDSRLLSHPKLSSPQSSTVAGRHKLQRRLSFDSSFLPSRVSNSPRDLEDEFQKLYHRFVCQVKSLSNGPPCRVCARSSEVSRGHSSSALAALALSPHRSVLRKRHRELEWDGHPQTKRSRDGYFAYSPGSRRHGKEMLKRFLSPTEAGASHDNLSPRRSKDVMAAVFTTQRPSTDTRQEGWMTQAQLVSSSVLSGGSPGKAKWQSGCSPRRRLLNREHTSGTRSCLRHLFTYCQCAPLLEN